jgi:hypothetical protein
MKLNHHKTKNESSCLPSLDSFEEKNIEYQCIGEKGWGNI